MCLGDSHSHKDWIFAITWMSDTVAVSSFHDNIMVLWKMDPNMFNGNKAWYNDTGLPVYSYIHLRDMETIPRASTNPSNCKV